ncbi:DNA-directed RNA polymerase I subunit RPA43 [Engraulis encrasicolus]|uniref:DNA-directed RNA polymerase I subunit RPA43 n=1 Tax=Engraulis encrasicolus TaxID=184585 RepID=UPI002FD0712B
MANLKQEEDDPEHAKMSTEIPTSTQTVPSDSVRRSIKQEADITCLIPSFAEACKLIDTPYSCLVLDTHRRHVALPPMHLKKKKTGIEEELNSELLKYSENLKGVPLAYDNIHLLGHHGDIFDDQGFIHFNIEASFVVFKPKKGQKLEGVINKIGLTHVGCLVHGCFNASIPKPKEMTAEQWRDSGLAPGGSLEFEVVQLDADVAGVLLIRGRLHKNWSEEKLHQTDPDTNISPVEASDNPAVDGASEGVDDDSQPKKKKKKKSKQVKEELEESLVSADMEPSRTDGDLNSNGHVEKKKKKKKKKDAEREMEGAEPVTPTELPGSDSSGYLSDKSSKKRKASGDTNGTGGLGDSETPVAKKKKNK